MTQAVERILPKSSELSAETGSLDTGERAGDARRHERLACHVHYQGHCHCGRVRFEVQIDPSAGTRKCNCSFCSRTRFWKVFVKAADFRLHRGAAELGEYRFGHALVEHRFCKHCGTQVFMRADCAPEKYVINMTCLDDAAQESLSAAPLRFEDGRNDNWWSAPEQTRHL